MTQDKQVPMIPLQVDYYVDGCIVIQRKWVYDLAQALKETITVLPIAKED